MLVGGWLIVSASVGMRDRVAVEAGEVVRDRACSCAIGGPPDRSRAAGTSNYR